jgi:hypothetical protein
MALQRIVFKPGVNRDQTNYAGEGGFYECDKIRFRSGFPQKIGGWLKASQIAFLGVCREMFGFVTTNSDNLLAMGTNVKVYLETGGNYVDITPTRAVYTSITSPSTDNCFDTTNGSTTVNVNITGHGAVTGDYVTFSGAAAVGGVPAAQLNTNHLITFVDVNNFTITVTTAATSTVSNGGGTAITAYFDISPGPAISVFGYGWGAGAWGAGGWGSGSLIPVVTLQRDWWFDQFDNDLVMNIRDGVIYYWTYNPAITGRATPLATTTIDGVAPSAVPTAAMQILVAQNNKHLLAFGCQPYAGSPTDFDPLLIRWSSQDAPNQWTPQVTNTAGFLRVSRGSKIVRAIATRQEILVLTESTLNSLQFLGTADVFGIQELADNISIIGPRAIITANNMTFWMGHDKFYAYSGRVETLPCSLRNHVFQNLNYDQADQIICGTNEGWNEIWWFYPTANSQTNNAYVIYNHLERIWYYGNIERTAWVDNALREYPQSAGGQYLYDHEKGVNDDLLPMNSYIQSNDFDISDGENFTLVKRIIPDVNFEGSTATNPQVLMTFRPRNFPGSNYMTEPEEAVTRTATVPVEQYTEQVFIRARARQMGFKVSSTELGVQWQLGAPRIDGRPDGKR